MTIERHHVGKRLSDMVVHRAPHAGTVYLAGQVADTPGKDITGQTQEVLASIDRLLAEAGTDKTKLLSATIFLPSMADFAALNAVWEAWVPQGHTPARATVEAKLADPAYKVEIQAVAAL
jgi:enamine deaminase RidA (YjgF/YER057c/UK114 family)